MSNEVTNRSEATDPWAVPDEVHAFLDYTRNTAPYYWGSERIGYTILELGSGSGSKRLIDLGATVHSVEHDPEYVGKYEGVNYIHAPIVNGWYDTAVLKERLRDLAYDVVVVDGPPGAIGRGGLFSNLDLFDTEKPFIFDDVHRQPEQELAIKVAKYLNKPISIHLLTDGRAFATLGFDLW